MIPAMLPFIVAVQDVFLWEAAQSHHHGWLDLFHGTKMVSSKGGFWFWVTWCQVRAVGWVRNGKDVFFCANTSFTINDVELDTLSQWRTHILAVRTHLQAFMLSFSNDLMNHQFWNSYFYAISLTFNRSWPRAALKNATFLLVLDTEGHPKCCSFSSLPFSNNLC